MSTDPLDAEPPVARVGADAGLGRRAARGAAVTLLGQGGKVLLQLVSVVVLARLLSPSDYGLVAMVATLVGVGELIRDFGLSSAAVQAPTLSRAQRDNLFWLNAGIGAAVGVVVLLAGAPLLALVYRQPAVIPVAQALSAVFLLNGLTTQYRASLVRGMRFRRLALADVLAPLIALTLAIAAALVGWGFWALVVQQLATSVVLLVVLAVSARWLPRWYRRGQSMAGLVRFGWNLAASQLVGYLSNNIDNLTVGIRFGTVQLGYYSRAFQLLMTPLNQVRTPMTTVALPVLSSLHAEPRRFSDYVTKGQLALGYTIIPLLAVVVGAAEPVTLLLLGPRWEPVVPLLALLAAAGIFQTLAFVGYWVYVARGLTGSLFRYSLVSAAIKVAAILVGSLGGVVGVAIGYAVAPALSWPLSLWWLSRRTETPTARLYAGAGRILALAVVAAVAAWTAATLLDGAPEALRALCALAAAAVPYALGAALIRPLRRDMGAVVAQARLVFGRARAGGPAADARPDSDDARLDPDADRTVDPPHRPDAPQTLAPED